MSKRRRTYDDADDEPDDSAEVDAEEEHETVDEERSAPDDASRRNVGASLSELAAFAACYGAVIGAAVAVMPWAKWTACVAGILWGTLMTVSHLFSPQRRMTLTQRRLARALGAMVGLITGAVEGAFFGVMAVAYLGAALGGLAGLLFKRLLGSKRKPLLPIFPGTVLLAAACGVAIQAFYVDHVRAAAGFGYGTLLGLAAGLFFCLVAFPLVFLARRRKS